MMPAKEREERVDEEFEKQVLEKFFEEEDFSRRRLLQLVDLLANFVKVNPRTGEVFVVRKDLPNKIKVGLVIAARFVAHRLNENVNPGIGRKEIADFTGVPEKIVSARATELVKEGIVSRLSSGTFTARSLISVEKWLEDIVKKYGGD